MTEHMERLATKEELGHLMPGSQEYHTHEYNPVMIPTGTAVSMLRVIEDDIAQVFSEEIDHEALHRAIKTLALQHGLRLR